MDFQRLLAKMAELDQPAVNTVATEAAVDECPETMASPVAASSAPSVPEPSMSLNLNAQGVDNIESLMKLMTKVNPDMINQPEPKSSMPSLTPPGPTVSPLGDLDKGPLKMLPDLDSETPDSEPSADLDSDDDIDLDSDDMKKDEWANSLDGSEPEVKDIDYMTNKLAGGMNRPKGTHPKVASGDNPMQKLRMDTRESIRVELLKRLAEAKGAK